MWDASYTNDGVKTSAVAQASFDLDLLAGTMVTGVEVSYSSARWNNHLVNGSGLVCFVIGNITSDYYSVSLDEYDWNYKTFSFGSDTDLAGLQASDFDGATNIVVQHCYAGEPCYTDLIPDIMQTGYLAGSGMQVSSSPTYPVTSTMASHRN